MVEPDPKQVAYALRANVDDYRWLALKHGDISEVHDRLTSNTCAIDWSPLAVELVEEEDHVGKELSDFPYFFGVPVFSARARQQLADLLISGDWLPLLANLGEFWVYHAPVVDCLDYERSTIERFRSSGRIKRVTRYVFTDAMRDEISVFRLPKLKQPVFATGLFKSSVEATGLTGFQFDLS